MSFECDEEGGRGVGRCMMCYRVQSRQLGIQVPAKCIRANPNWIYV